MYQEFQYFDRELQAAIKKQEGRIQNLERLVSQLTKELDELKQKPAVRVDKIEYKFDQLKVETLKGTLNIGLNPSDLQGIDSFEVNNGPGQTFDPKGVFRSSMEMEEEIYQVLETDLLQLVNNAEMRTNQKLSENYYEFIKEDIKKQIPARVQHYIKQSPMPEEDDEKEAWKQNIIQTLLKEMENGICTFISNLPNNMKG